MYKDFQTKIEDVDEKGRVLVAANAIGNVDADQDRSMPGSFNKTLKENFHRLRWLLNHDKDLLIGCPIEGREEDSMLKMLGQLNLKKEIGRDTYEDYKLYAEHGKSLEHSIGVEAIKKDQKENVRNVHEWKLWEYSTLYGWGANEMTSMLGIKSAQDISESINWLEILLKKGNYTDIKFLQITEQLSQLKSLCIEPSKDTQPEEPMNEMIDAIKQFRLTLNLQEWKKMNCSNNWIN